MSKTLEQLTQECADLAKSIAEFAERQKKSEKKLWIPANGGKVFSSMASRPHMCGSF